MSGYAAARYYAGGMKSLRAAEKQLRADERENAEVIHELSLLMPDEDEWALWWERIPADANYRQITARARLTIAEIKGRSTRVDDVERGQFETNLRHGG